MYEAATGDALPHDFDKSTPSPRRALEFNLFPVFYPPTDFNPKAKTTTENEKLLHDFSRGYLVMIGRLTGAQCVS